MDERLVKAARDGDVTTLLNLLEADPEILERACSVHFADSPLHIAALYGKADFVEQIVTRKPSLARETNQQGMIPLHLASLGGHVETVRELLKAKLDDDGVNQCLLKDEEGWTPLHCASQKGNIMVMEELMNACPRCLEQVTAKGETVLHVAVKANRFEAVKVLADSIRHHSLHTLLKAEDQKGKSVYQLAAAKKQLQILGVLREDDGEGDKIRLERCLNVEGETSESEEFRKQESKDSEELQSKPNDPILVVAALLITLTFQAMADPPSTFFKDGSTNIDWACRLPSLRDVSNIVDALKNCPALLPSMFLIFNTLMLLHSILAVIIIFRCPKRLLFIVKLPMLYLILSYSSMLTAVNYNLAYFTIPLVWTVLLVAVLLLRENPSFRSKLDKLAKPMALRLRWIHDNVFTPSAS